MSIWHPDDAVNVHLPGLPHRGHEKRSVVRMYPDDSATETFRDRRLPTASPLRAAFSALRGAFAPEIRMPSERVHQ